MLAFSGFNGFGQFGREHDQKVVTFREFKVDEHCAKKTLHIGASWSYNIFATDYDLVLRGFISHGPNAEVNIKLPGRVKQVDVCDRFSLILLDSGKLYKLLPKENALLEEVKFVTTHNQVNPHKRSIFGELKQREAFEITHVACGSTIAVAFSNRNEVYNLPSKVDQFPKHFRVKQLICGNEHALLLSQNGDVYSWGNGLRGQLGLDELGVEEKPVLISALAGIKIRFIAAGCWHNCAISSFGDLYVWGWNCSGQIGLQLFKPSSVERIKEPTVYHLPQIIDNFKCCDSSSTEDAQCTPWKVFAGERHTILQMSCGALHAAGWNEYGQLSIEQNNEFLDQFTKIKCITNASKCDIICGPWCTIMKEIL